MSREGTAHDVPLSVGGSDRAEATARGTAGVEKEREWLLKQAGEGKAALERLS